MSTKEKDISENDNIYGYIKLYINKKELYSESQHKIGQTLLDKM